VVPLALPSAAQNTIILQRSGHNATRAEIKGAPGKLIVTAAANAIAPPNSGKNRRLANGLSLCTNACTWGRSVQRAIQDCKTWITMNQACHAAFVPQLPERQSTSLNTKWLAAPLHARPLAHCISFIMTDST
jgi:hypothetical protein